MPPAPKTTPEARRARERELESRRARGEVSCAECRRSKLKCDKKIPCSSCVRRGCPTICPNGCLSRAGQGSRLVLAEADKLHRKLLEMSKRIRQLEDALQIAHATVSAIRHPLLSEELLGIKSGVESPSDEGEDQEMEDDIDDVDSDILGSFGTLAISSREEIRFFGRSGSDALLFGEPSTGMPPSQVQDSTVLSNLPVQVSQLSKSFPFAPMYLPEQEILELIGEQLPTFERATALCEAYLENLSWFFRPIDRYQIMEELLPSVYKKWRGNTNQTGSFGTKLNTEVPDVGIQDLAALLMVLAVGAVGDLTLAPYNDEAELYYNLSRAALCLKPVFDGAGLGAVQAICLMGAYDLFSCRKNSMERAWKLLSFGMSLAAGIGLHRDPTRWKLHPKMVQRRRRVFWELYVFDAWRGLGSGRPTTWNPRIVDCEMPDDMDATHAEDGTEIPSFWRWKHHFINDVVTGVVDKLGSARALKYSEILEMDRKVRDFSSQKVYKQSAKHGGANVSVQRIVMDFYIEQTIMSIHRNFFARAMLEDPVNPLRSVFAPSFLAAYRSATSLLKLVREHFDSVSHLMLRLWPIWAHALVASVILGSVATRGTSSSEAPRAFAEFDLTITLFQRAQIHPAVKGGLPILLRMREKAQRALYEFRAGSGVGLGAQPSSSIPLASVKKENDEDELEVLGGKSRFLHGDVKCPFPPEPTAPTRKKTESTGNFAPLPQLVSNPPSSGPTHPAVPASTGNMQNTSPELSTVTQNAYHQEAQGHGGRFSPETDNVVNIAGRRAIPHVSAVSPGIPTRYTHQVHGGAPLDPSGPAKLFSGYASHLPHSTSFMDTGGDKSSQYTPSSVGSMELAEASAPAFFPDLSRGSSPGGSLYEIPSVSMNADFDISVDMRSGVREESLVPLQTFEDASIAEAWRTIMQDPRFFNQYGFNNNV